MSRSRERDTTALVLGGVPRAHLMPLEVAQGKKDAARRRGLISIMALAAIVVAVGVAASFWFAAQAEARLAEERAATEQLLAEQLTYSEVLEVRGQLSGILEQRLSVTEREILWRDIATPYLRIVSADGVLESATLTTAALGDPALLRQDPLRTQSVATMVLTVSTPGLPQPYRWLRAFETLPTHGDTSLDTITGEEGFYLTTVTINLNAQALSGRLTDEAGN